MTSDSTITQHRPAYFTGFENEVVHFTTAEDLLRIPFVANFRTLEQFHRYSLWIEDGRPVGLMAECDEGRRWFVVGFIKGQPPSLPTWKPVR